jgi:uncharacterized membrane protein YozB (DUF420 family)
MTTAFGLVVVGVRRIRRGEVAAHRRSMLSAAGLVVTFLVAYLLKSFFIGSEDLSVWGDLAVLNLRIHEFCVFTMLLAGGFALYRGTRLTRSRQVTGDPGDPLAPESHVRWHRRAGRTAAVATGLGWFTACIVLAGMYSRLPG